MFSIACEVTVQRHAQLFRFAPLRFKPEKKNTLIMVMWFRWMKEHSAGSQQQTQPC